LSLSLEVASANASPAISAAIIAAKVATVAAIAFRSATPPYPKAINTPAVLVGS